jgi:hypothetical protein
MKVTTRIDIGQESQHITTRMIMNGGRQPKNKKAKEEHEQRMISRNDTRIAWMVDEAQQAHDMT